MSHPYGLDRVRGLRRSRAHAVVATLVLLFGFSGTACAQSVLPSTPVIFVLQWFIPFFVAMWFGVTGLLSYLSGWPVLAARFRSATSVVGEHFRFVSGSVGVSNRFPVNYRNCLFITVGITGFRISVLFLFRLFSPPLLIPWSQVESVTEQRYWFIHRSVIRIRGFSGNIIVPDPVGQCITQAYARHSAGSAI